MENDFILNRRRFSRRIISSIAGVALLSGCHPQFYSTSVKNRNPIILPPGLREGDRIGLIAPASHANEDKIQKAVSNLESLGLYVVEGKYLREENGFVAGSDRERVEDIHTMFRRKDINGIWCVRGGYGTTRILEMLDYGLIRSHPKVFVGYSDITALHQAIFTQSGLVTFHGPVASSEFSDFSMASIRKALFDDAYHYDTYPLNIPGEGEESQPVVSLMWYDIYARPDREHCFYRRHR
jgi:muramoyltetrapeptide carboxypeptidase